MTQEIKPQAKKVSGLRTSKELPDRETLLSHRLTVYVNNKAELIEPYVPGTIYYREMMRYKAKIRDNVRKMSKHNEMPLMLERNLRHERKPRTIVALRTDLQRQLDQQKELEHKYLIQELRDEERVRVQYEFQRLNVLPEIVKSTEISDTTPEMRRPRTADPDAISRLEAAEINGETAKQYGVFEMPLIQNRRNVPRSALHMNTVDNVDQPRGSATDSGPREPDGLDTGSNPGSLGRSSLKTIVLPPSDDGGIFVMEVIRHHGPAQSEPLPSFPSSCSLGRPEDDQESKRRFANSCLRDQVKLHYENPDYRDWETSEKSMDYLEERIQKFHSGACDNLKPIQLPRLARYENAVSS